MILGLTGSIGSGKSTVARMFEEQGSAVVIDADAIARQVMEPGGSAYKKVVTAFGPGILEADGRINRKRLAEIVFGDAEKRLLLNSIVHPCVRDEEIRLREQHRQHPLVVLMVPLLFENAMEHLADKVAVVTVDEESRLRRLYERSQMPADEVARRLAAQMPDQEKIRLADYVIDNSGTLEQTREQVRAIIEKSRLNQ